MPLPSSFDITVFDPFSGFWRPKQIDSLFKHGVWKLEQLPPGALILPCKVVSKVKPEVRDPPGIEKFKYRYCGKGFVQKKDIHYFDSTAPVASSTVIV